MRQVILFMDNFNEKTVGGKMKRLVIVMRALIFFMIGILLFLFLSPLFVPKTGNSKKGFYRAIIQGFYDEPENSLDAVFIGESSIYKSISPIEMWEEHGFASYDFASPGQKIWDSYYCMKEALKYQKPKVIILNADQAFDAKPLSKFFKSHLYDNMPLSMNKIEAVMDPVQKNTTEEMASYLFPIFKYHSRWSELDEEDFEMANENYHYAKKGYVLIKKKKAYKGDNNYLQKEDKTNKITPESEKYLLKIKELCQENGIPLLLLEMPAPKVWNKTKQQEMTKWAVKNNVAFLDLNKVVNEMGIDWKTDTSDKGIHMNIYGAKKVTKYVGNYLKENYSLPDHRNDPNYRHWKQDQEEYEKACNI